MRGYLRTSLLLGLIASAACFGQAVSQITGVTRDQTGAVVPGVEVTATNTDTGTKRSAVTDESGAYLLVNLAVGPYKVEAMKMGFRTYVQTGIDLQVGTAPTIPIT